jgi:hypothetical protein
MCRLAFSNLSSLRKLHVPLFTGKPKRSYNDVGMRGTMRSHVVHRHRQRDP